MTFTAQFASFCRNPECGRTRIEAGEMVKYAGHDLVHDVCPTPADPLAHGSICGRCFMEIPPSGDHECL